MKTTSGSQVNSQVSSESRVSNQIIQPLQWDTGMMLLMEVIMLSKQTPHVAQAIGKAGCINCIAAGVGNLPISF